MKFQCNNSLLENKNKFSLNYFFGEVVSDIFNGLFIMNNCVFDKGMPQHNGFLSSVQNLVKTRHRGAIYFSPTKQL